jgi:predicted metal-dependent phosphoesterase TrpH
MRADFHLHTTHSDGRSLPSDLAKMVHHQHIQHWCITDHDTTAAYEHLPAADLPPICGVEVSAHAHEIGEVHIVALGIDRSSAKFQEFLQEIRSARYRRMDELCGALRQQGAEITLDDVLAEVPHADHEPSRVLTRSFLVQALRRRQLQSFADGYFDASRLSTSNLYFPDIHQAISQIHAADGIAILAHPGCYNNHSTVRQLLESAPFDGLESNHPRLLPRDRAFFRTIAENMRLLESCGSDFHGRPDAIRPPGRCRLEKRRIQPLLERLGLPTTLA